MGAKYVLELGLRYQVGDGKSIRIWEVPWLHTIPTFIPQPKVQDTRQVTWVRELMAEDGKTWNVELLVQLFRQTEVESIIQIAISQVGSRDRLVWHFHNKGFYTVQSAYQQLQMRSNQQLQRAGTKRGAEQARAEDVAQNLENAG